MQTRVTFPAFYAKTTSPDPRKINSQIEDKAVSELLEYLCINTHKVQVTNGVTLLGVPLDPNQAELATKYSQAIIRDRDLICCYFLF